MMIQIVLTIVKKEDLNVLFLIGTKFTSNCEMRTIISSSNVKAILKHILFAPPTYFLKNCMKIVLVLRLDLSKVWHKYYKLSED